MKIQKSGLSISLLILTALVGSVSVATNTKAADLSQFQAGRIIDDRIFTDAHSLSADQIQDFLNKKNSVCLKDFQSLSLNDDNGDGIVQDSTTEQYGPETMSAAQLIASAADIYNINPKVLLVTLQKEQGLITTTDCAAWKYNTALGYGCPDTAPCDQSAYGFTRQIDYGTYHLRGFFDDSLSSVPYGVGNYSIAYNPNSSCGSSVVNIQNRSTASLYSYTPYQPNAASLAAGYGLGDSCSSYGNRNFFSYFTDWFGSTFTDDTIVPHPDGTLISMDGKVFLIQNGLRRHIGGGSIFDSYRYKWDSVKPATTGDRNLSNGAGIYSLNPDRLYRAPGTGVYTLTTSDNGSTWMKQHVTYNAYTSLGYKWSDVMLVPANELPSTNSPTPYDSPKHRNGDLINSGGNVYYIDNNTLRYVGGAIYNSYNWPWDIILPATAQDLSIPTGERQLYREGTVLHDGANVYVIKLPASGYEIKRPIGPWECYSTIFKYNSNDLLRVNSWELPTTSGDRVTCI